MRKEIYAYILAVVCSLQIMFDCKMAGVPNNVNSIVMIVTLVTLMYVFRKIAGAIDISVRSPKKKRKPPKFYDLKDTRVSEDTYWPMIEL